MSEDNKRTVEDIYNDIFEFKRMREKESSKVWYEWSKKIYNLEEELHEMQKEKE